MPKDPDVLVSVVSEELVLSIEEFPEDDMLEPEMTC